MPHHQHPNMAPLPPLHLAALSPDHADLRRQLSSPSLSDIHKTDYAGYTPLLRAAQRGLIKNVRILLQAGADPNAATNTGETSLHFAVKGSHRRLIDLLIAARAKLNAEAALATPLTYAIRGRHMDIARLLLSRGARATHHDLRALLRHAEDMTFERAAQLFSALMAAGATLYYPRPAYLVTRDVCREVAGSPRRPLALRLLMHFGAATDPAQRARTAWPMLTAAVFGNFAALDLFSDYGVDWQSLPLIVGTQQPILWAAMSAGKDLVVKLLIRGVTLPPKIDSSVQPILIRLNYESMDYINCVITAIIASGVSAEVFAAVASQVRSALSVQRDQTRRTQWAAYAALFGDVSRFRERAEAVRVDKAYKIKIP